jgi:alcohol dehydrogenase
MMSSFELAGQNAVLSGVGTRRNAGELAAAFAGKGAPVLFVADPGLKASGLVDDVAASLAQAGLDVHTVSDFSGDPSVAQTNAAASIARKAGAKAVVALGGGSALDLAKSVAAIAPATESALVYQLCERDFPAGTLPCIAIPTTSGTGSEATRTAILTRPDKAKTWLWGEAVKPVRVILDPEATLSLPPGLTAATGIDALVHALEAATNARANEGTGIFALEAIRLAMRHLERAVSHGDDLEARAGMSRAAWLAGIAIDNGGTAAGHMIGHALGSLLPVHHGRAVALGMIATLAWNVETDDGRFARAAEAMGLARATDIPAAFERLARAIGIPVSLETERAGLRAEQLAAQCARPENAAMRNANFRAIGDDDLLRFAETVLGQT